MRLFLSLVLLVNSSMFSFAQCGISLSTTIPDVSCGDTIQVFVIDTLEAGYILEDFNDSALPVGWTSSAVLSYTNICSASMDGSPTAWFGSSTSTGPRNIETIDYDFTCGGSISFNLDYGADDACGSCGACDDPDTGNEGVNIQYSTDGGGNWTNLYFFEPNVFKEGYNYVWSNHGFSLPPDAWSSTTRFRWIQLTASNALFDHWGIDNVQIAPTSCSSTYYTLWDGILGANDSTFVITSGTSFNIEYTNGIDDTCYASMDFILNSFDTVDSTDVCAGVDYTFPDGYTEFDVQSSVTHVSNLFSIEGCDSTISSYIEVMSIDTSIAQSGLELSSNENGLVNYQWLDCDNAYTPLPGETGQNFICDTIGSYALELSMGGCIDTSACQAITAQDFYGTSGYSTLFAEIWTFPTSVLDSCDALALAFATGGVPPYQYDWYTQINNQDTAAIDSLCYGFHVLTVIDAIGDTLALDYYITDSINYYYWYDSLQANVDTIYIATPNCVIDLNLPLDSAYVLEINYLYPDTSTTGDYYILNIEYFQNGESWVSTDTVSLDISGTYIIHFSVYCPTKSLSKIKTIILSFNFPDILGITESAKEELVLYPNPVEDQLFLQLTDIAGVTDLYIYDSSGKMIKHLKPQATGKLIKITTADLSSGLYSLQVIGETVQSVQFVKL